MVDMVRKHTVEGSGNWRTIMDMVNRADEMLKTSKQLSWSFVRVLIGAPKVYKPQSEFC